ncbi:hypothetical protein Taro_021193 [Colocasia esculenta]|uniref:Uncharacterized protein n=1 Tax=Colocasia esculenta TaxID=4460 RepID=A0A843V4A7_COLES|nr:hypothetical protein [Colocasia esculenta]
MDGAGRSEYVVAEGPFVREECADSDLGGPKPSAYSDMKDLPIKFLNLLGVDLLETQLVEVFIDDGAANGIQDHNLASSAMTGETLTKHEMDTKQPADLWIYLDSDEVLDLATISMENVRQLFMYIGKLPLFMSGSVLGAYNFLIKWPPYGSLALHNNNPPQLTANVEFAMFD